MGDTLERALAEPLDVLARPFIIGELALGNMRRRDAVLTLPADLPRADVATDAEVQTFIDRHALYGRGIGCVDVHLLAAARLTVGARLRTKDREVAHDSRRKTAGSRLREDLMATRLVEEDAIVAQPAIGFPRRAVALDKG